MNTQKILTGLVAGAALFAMAPTAMAQDMFQDFDLSANFLPDPAEGNGLAGGSVDAGPLGPNCIGNIDDSADHNVTLNDAFDYLRFRVRSDDDTTLVIKGPNGEYYCNDDTHGLDPEVSGSFGSGNYEVYVGVFGGGNPEYQIEISELGGNSGSSNSGASNSGNDYEDLTIATGFIPDPAVLTGQSGGSVNASSLNGACIGQVDSTPDHTVTLQDSFSYLRFDASSSGDTSLVIRGPNGTYYCNDDTVGLNPRVDGSFSAGDYEVYIGQVGESARYRLEVSELRP